MKPRYRAAGPSVLSAWCEQKKQLLTHSTKRGGELEINIGYAIGHNELNLQLADSPVSCCRCVPVYYHVSLSGSSSDSILWPANVLCQVTVRYKYFLQTHFYNIDRVRGCSTHQPSKETGTREKERGKERKGGSKEKHNDVMIGLTRSGWRWCQRSIHWARTGLWKSRRKAGELLLPPLLCVPWVPLPLERERETV